jgi:hypothetical protein
MATTITGVKALGDGKTRYTLTLAAQNDTFVFSAVNPTAISFQGEGISASDLTLQCSNDGENYYAMPTAATLAADGVKSVAVADLGFAFYRLIEETASETVTASLVITEHR